MSLRNPVFVGGLLAASVVAIASIASIAAAQPGVTTPLFPRNPNPSTLMTSSVTTGGILEGSALALSGRMTPTLGMTVTANGATVDFSRPVHVRITVEEAGAKITSTSYITVPAAEKAKTRLQSSSGNMVFTVFNDSEGKDLLMKVRASDVTYSWISRPTAKTPTVTPPK
ncbi:MAG: hypothetical protein V4671_26865 [Armatimonadota bacterium]